jgi:integrase
VQRFRDGKQERFLSPAELERLGKTLSAAEAEGKNPVAIAAIRLLVLTGCRKSELLNLKWSHVDQAYSCLRLPASKTGAKIVPLGAAALALLDPLPRLAGNPYVFPGAKAGGHLVGLPRFFEGVRRRADLGDVRLHDLRHSFASAGAAGGLSLPLIGALLGHKDPKTTQRYAHLADDPVKAPPTGFLRPSRPQWVVRLSATALHRPCDAIRLRKTIVPSAVAERPSISQCAPGARIMAKIAKIQTAMNWRSA